MPQFLVEKNIRVGETVALGADDSKHVSKVLRLSKGDWLVISDGKGARFKALITEAGHRQVKALIEEELPKLKTPDLTLAIAITKHDKTEFIIQKSVELGVGCIMPFTAKRTIPKFSEGLTETKLKRWNKIALEAAKQCGQPARPVVMAVSSFEDMLTTSEHFTNKILFFEGEKSATLGEYSFKGDATIIVIGPEGGFAPDEVALAKKSGFATLKLGALIMRVETAAIAAITLTQNKLGYF